MTLPELHAAQEALRSYPEVLRTPLLPRWPVGSSTLSLKLESLQNTGSFKIRGMRYKIHQSDVTQLQSKGVVTLSAGNAGRAVAFLGQATGLDVKVFMPSTAPDDRKALMEAIGATVVKVRLGRGLWCALCTVRRARCGERLHESVCVKPPHTRWRDSRASERRESVKPRPTRVRQVAGEQLLESVADCIATEDRVLIHPFDDVDLIRGHASCGKQRCDDVSRDAWYKLRRV